MLGDLLGHPLAALRFRREAVPEIMSTQKVGRLRAWGIVNDAQDAEIAVALKSAAAQKNLTLPAEVHTALTAAVGGKAFEAIGDGSIIKAIGDFFKAHPEIIKLAVAILMGLIGL